MALTRLGLNQAVNLSTNTTGTLGVANGGTGLASGTSGQFLKFTGTTTVASSAVDAGIGVAEVWGITDTWTSNNSIDPILSSNWAKFAAGGEISAGITASSGVFTFPSTGIWLIQFHLEMNASSGSQDRGMRGFIQTTTNNSSYADTVETNFQSSWTSNSNAAYNNGDTQLIFDVTSTSTHKVRFAMGTQQGNSNTVRSGSGTSLRTSVVFLRLGDT
jgi:hypothetical protein